MEPRSLVALLSHQAAEKILRVVRLTTSFLIPLPVPTSKLPHLSTSAFLRSLVTPIPSFDSQPLERQLQRYLRFLAKAGQPDILIVGSSRALHGIDPIVLEQSLANRAYPNLKSFNFGLNGATA